MRIAAVYEEAVGVVAIGQLRRKSSDSVCPQSLGELPGGSLPAAVVIGTARGAPSHN